MILKYLFIFLSISFSNLVFADGSIVHVYNVSPYPVKAWANYAKSRCNSYTMEINPNTPSWDWSPPPFCGLDIAVLNDVNYEFTDKNGVKQTYWILGQLHKNRQLPLGYHDVEMDVCIYGDPAKDSFYETSRWQPCKPYNEICKDPVYGMKCDARTGDKPK